MGASEAHKPLNIFALCSKTGNNGLTQTQIITFALLMRQLCEENNSLSLSVKDCFEFRDFSLLLTVQALRANKYRPAEIGCVATYAERGCNVLF